MRGLNLSYLDFKNYSFKHRQLYSAAMMMLFFAVFDGILSFIMPIYMVKRGISPSLMGVIIGLSSVAGLFFDLLLARLLKNIRFRRTYLIMYLACFIYPLIIWRANSVLLFLIAMTLWGLYYDLFNFAKLDFIAHQTLKMEYSSSSGILSVFINLGYLLAPIISGLLIYQAVNYAPFLTAWIFLSLSFLCFLLVLTFTQKAVINYSRNNPNFSFVSVLKSWKNISVYILPVLVVTLIININEAFFWTIGPLFSVSLTGLKNLGGIFMASHMLPALFAGWFIGSLTARLGKKRTAFLGLGAGSLVLVFFAVTNSAAIIILLCLISSFCLSLVWPALDGAFADYMTANPKQEKEINTLQDFYGNLGFIIGPILAGLLAQFWGLNYTFAWLGIFGVIATLILYKVTPRHIRIKSK